MGGGGVGGVEFYDWLSPVIIFMIRGQEPVIGSATEIHLYSREGADL